MTYDYHNSWDLPCYAEKAARHMEANEDVLLQRVSPKKRRKCIFIDDVAHEQK